MDGAPGTDDGRAPERVPADQQACIDRLERLRWKGDPRCLKCGSRQIRRRTDDPERRDRWFCSNWRCKTSFSITQDTIFQGSQVPLPVWFEMIRAVLSRPDGIATADIARRMDVTYGTAGRMIRRIRGFIADEGPDALRELVDGAFYDGDQRSAISDQRSAISDQRSAISDQRSAISDQRSAISDQRSAISDQRSVEIIGRKGDSTPDGALSIPGIRPRFVPDSDGPLGTLVPRDPARPDPPQRVLPTSGVREFVRRGGRLLFRPSPLPFEKGWLAVGLDAAGGEYPVYCHKTFKFRHVRSAEAADAYVDRMTRGG